MMSVRVSVKNQMTAGFVEIFLCFMWNPGRCDCLCNNSQKIDKYLDIKNCLCEKHLFGKLVLGCEDEILNATETALNDKKVTRKKVLAFFIRFR